MSALQPFWSLPALLLFVAYFLIRVDHGDGWMRIIRPSVLLFLQRDQTASSRRHPALLLAAVACLALSSPSLETKDSKTYQHTQGWIILADVSRSMTLTDTVPSRLSAMRDAANKIAVSANANSTTLIAYSGDAFVIAPPSFDSAYLKTNVNLLEHGTIPLDGSNLTRAFSLAWSVIENSNLVNARLFVLTDTGGFNTRSDAAAARLASLGHRTDFIIFGSEDSGSAAPFDLESARNMANSGHGALIQADIVGNINYAHLALNKINTDDQFLTQTGITTLRWSNQSHWLLLVAIPILLLAFRRELE